ncbi:MAG: Choline-glycine betaine transporter [uncultured archaeon A07HB70]|nr:MAG: Choline-glycine betaine transporter [uncultured archaeon A07HB70]
MCRLWRGGLCGIFLPTFVGDAVSGATWLAVSLVFFVSGLAYLAVLPGDETSSESVLLGLRRTGLAGTVREFVGRHDPMVLGVPAVVFALFVAARAAFPAATTGAVDAVSGAVLRQFGVFFLGTVLVAVAYCVFLLLGPWGDVRLGGPDAEPTYTYPTYFTLIFTAGIAAGIVFWGPAESLFHYQTPPPYFDAAPRSDAAVGGALTYALFHWGLSAWSAYAVVGVPVAYYVFERGAPLRVSAILTPFLGPDGLDTLPARVVDTLAVFATVGGIATSVALVSEQFLAGIGFQWGVTTGQTGPVLFVGGLTLVVVLSAVTGVHRGIRRLAGVNVALFVLFAVVVAAVGPLGVVSDRGAAALGSYAVNFVPLSLHVGGAWVAEWTVWNWSWWFSWAPFAGLFVAALSRGRRVRTVVFTGVVATSLATIAWFVLLGGTSLWVQRTGVADVLGAVAARGGAETVVGFQVFAALPLGQLLTFLFLALIVVFMATSADTSTLVVSVLAAREGVAPSTGSVVFWGVFQGAVAVSLLLVGGGQTLQALAVLTGGPFAVLSLVALAGLTLSFYRRERGRGHESLVTRLGSRLPTVQTHHDVEPPEE